ncbi:hypothetical protein CXF72_17000 [Psychromonas sp. MB-3u-54]|uniref:protein DpdF n=1 Tax=Psychromonas sp. MB-3u-54 TaxID=2058319 RepID=UPI000C33BA23|nr:protein DpdF [Psychromonas sp. MB-3u-54]PKH01370.1 hypothetical protein CXF72_17000 [Psychromonas sp. MB-3u-54]
MYFWNFYPLEKKTELLDNIEHFDDTQFKKRLVQSIESSNLSLNEFWYLAKDLLASEVSHSEPSIYLGKRPTLDQFKFALKCGLKFDPTSNSVILAENSLSKYVKPVYGLIQKRYSQEPLHDTILKNLNLPYLTYTNLAQREAVRTALSSEPDATVIVNLPTAGGKTLVTEVLTAFIKPDELNIVVIPTTALALDQARRMKVFVENMGYSAAAEYAWRGDLKPEVKKRIKADILSGQQRVLFVSPESMVSGILPTLFKAVESRKLKNVIFDEAHLIDTWGESFRPEFQKVGAFLNALKQKGGVFRKVFLSATFTDQTLVTIKTLFGDPGVEPILVNGAFLRPEPITLKTEVSEDAYLQTVIDKVISSPKPLVVYASTKVDCLSISDHLSALAIGRKRVFTGDTNDSDRKKIIQSWSADEVDIIIATSAFGVGMDKNDVRCVLHAGISENIDSFYQEIGRSGRDGRASYCEVIYHQAHYKKKVSQNKTSKIGTNLGYKRWQSMWKNRKEIRENIYQIKVRSQAHHIERNSEANETWNWKTLLLMQRAGLIRLSYPDATQVPKEQEEWSVFWQNFSNQILVEIVHDRHVIQETWESVVEPHRTSEVRLEKQRIKYLLDWINGTNQLCDVLQDSYQLDGLMPSKVCGICDVDNDRVKRKYLVGQSVRVKKKIEDFPENNLFYFELSNHSTEEIMKAFRKVVLDGKVLMLVCSKSFLKKAEPSLKSLNQNVWFYGDLQDYFDDNQHLKDYPKFIVQDDKFFSDKPKQPDEWQEKYSNYFVANSNLKDPTNTYRKWWESGNTVQKLTYLVNS